MFRFFKRRAGRPGVAEDIAQLAAPPGAVTTVKFMLGDGLGVTLVIPLTYDAWKGLQRLEAWNKVVAYLEGLREQSRLGE